MGKISIFSIFFSILGMQACLDTDTINYQDDSSAVNSPVEPTIMDSDTLPGFQLYSDNCASCHGIDGAKRHYEARDLSKSNLSLEERVKIISSAQLIGDKMHQSRWKQDLSHEEIIAVAEYLEKLRK